MVSKSDRSKKHLFYGVVLARSVTWSLSQLQGPRTVKPSKLIFAQFWASSNALVLALWQLKRHLGYTKALGVDWVDWVEKVGNEYLDAVVKSGLKDLRNVMQHTDEYVACEGHVQSLAPEPLDRWAIGRGVGDGDGFQLTYLGTTYELGQLITLAARIEHPLYFQFETYNKGR